MNTGQSLDSQSTTRKDRTMNEYAIVKCRLCDKLMKRYPYAVYRGDSSCCDECNRKVSEQDKEKSRD